MIADVRSTSVTVSELSALRTGLPLWNYTSTSQYGSATIDIKPLCVRSQSGQDSALTISVSHLLRGSS